MSSTVQLRNQVLLLLLLVGGVCAQDSSASGGFPIKEKLSTFEKSFTPSYYDNSVHLFMKTDTAKVYGSSLDQMTSAPPETLQGYRIQLLSTNDFDVALSLRNQLNTEYPQLWVYTVYETPSYKIRVGDYINRTDAQAMLDTLQSNGFSSAWIVPDMVINNQPPKPPMPEPIDSTFIKQE